MDMARLEVPEREPEWNRGGNARKRNPYLAGQEVPAGVRSQRRQAAQGYRSAQEWQETPGYQSAQRRQDIQVRQSVRRTQEHQDTQRRQSVQETQERRSIQRRQEMQDTQGRRSVQERQSIRRRQDMQSMQRNQFYQDGPGASRRRQEKASREIVILEQERVQRAAHDSRQRAATDRSLRVQPGYDNTPVARPAAGRGMDSQRARHLAKQRRLRILRMQRLAVMFGFFCILALLGVLLLQYLQEPQEDTAAVPQEITVQNDEPVKLVQGIPADVYAKHPNWEENFLTPNEYSRPGDPLKEITNVFVHYTANPGTSAAQNRSYFEQQKDTHERSVSSHFIIGYEGEIIQCVPLDEIAYAVQTRNEDSISIECCYLAADGSFTQETYDSLIALLRWLTDTYGLDSEDILRHYDCGGKKCPIYYTENEDAWERLKKDVDALSL